MDALPVHPALDATASWPTLPMWIRWQDERLDYVSLVPVRDVRPDGVLLPYDPEHLRQLGEISLGLRRAGLYAAFLAADREDRRLVLCPRGACGALRIVGTPSSVADVLYKRTREAMLAAGQVQRTGGCPDAAAQWSALARQLMKAKRTVKRGRSVRAVAGGLPTLGRNR